jgi:hypothetical protein
VFVHLIVPLAIMTLESLVAKFPKAEVLAYLFSAVALKIRMVPYVILNVVHIFMELALCVGKAVLLSA